jgi:mRNA interferase MazF
VFERLEIADVVVVSLPEHHSQGHEQEDRRPAIVVGVPERLAAPRFQLVIIAPLTTDREQTWAIASPELYPRLTAGNGGLPQNSLVLLDQIRAIDLKRVARYLGTLTLEQYQPITNGLKKIL